MSRNKLLLSLALSISGVILLGVFGNWKIALGAFLFMWGNNLQLLSVIKEKS